MDEIDRNLALLIISPQADKRVSSAASVWACRVWIRLGRDDSETYPLSILWERFQ